MSAIVNAVPRNDFSDIANAPEAFNVLSAHYGETKAAAQLALEHEAYVLGEERFRKALDRQIEAGEMADNKVSAPLMSTLIPALAGHIDTWVATKQRGRPHVAKKYLAEVDSMVAAYITIKTLLPMLARDNTATVQAVGVRLGSNLEDEIRFSGIRKAESDYFKKYVQVGLNKRNGELFKREYMKAVEAGMIQDGTLAESAVHTTWPTEERFHVGIRLLELLIEATGLVDLKKNEHEFDSATFVVLAPEYVERIASRAHALSGMSPMYQPCVVPPKPWTSLYGGGYWAKGRRPLSLIRVHSKRAMKRYKGRDLSKVMHAVNTIQNTAWAINEDVLAVANRIVHWEHCPVADVPSIAKEDLPERIEGMDTNEEILKQWKRSAAAIYRRERARQSKRMSLEFTLAQANKFANEDAIYFPHNLDWRGRVYAVTSFSPQGTDLTKGLLRFAEGHKLGTEGAYWLGVHGANTFGNDKVSLDERVQWVNDNEEMILSCAANPLDDTRWADSDSPFCFLAFCHEWAGYVASGRSEDYVSHIAIAFDGTCSGLQHFSAMLRDEVGGRAVNLIPADKPQDVYGIVAARVTEMLNRDAKNGESDGLELVKRKVGKETEEVEILKRGSMSLAMQWLEFCEGKVSRSITKRSVMTLAYGSKKFGFTDQVREDTVMPAIDNGTGHMFTEPQQAAAYMAGLIWDAVNVEIKAAPVAMKWVQDVTKLVSSNVKDKKTKEITKEAAIVEWTTPVGFTVFSDYRVQDMKRIDCVILGGMRLTAMLAIGETPEIDTRKQVSGIAPNFVHSMDASHLMMTVIKANEAYNVNDFAMIHDSFGTHAGKAGDLFKAVREEMVAMYSENDVLAQFLESNIENISEEQRGDIPAMPAQYNLDLNQILESRYTFS